MANPKSIDISGFERLFQKTDKKEYGPLGRIKIKYNPEAIAKKTGIPGDSEIGAVHKGDAYVSVVLEQDQLDMPITFFLVNIEEKGFKVVANSWWQSSIGLASFEHEESGNHPFVLSWRQFLQVQGKELTSDEVIDELSSGDCFPVILNISESLEILNGWVSWLEKYCA